MTTPEETKNENYSRTIEFHFQSRTKDSLYPNNSVRSTEAFLLYFFISKLQKVPVVFFTCLLVAYSSTISFSLEIFLPLVLLLATSFLWELSAYLKTLKAEAGINKSPVKVWNGQEFAEFPTREIKVGNIVLVNEGEKVPADLLILCGSEKITVDEFRIKGVKNLQVKYPIRELPDEDQPLSEVLPELSYTYGTIKASQPSADFNYFEGKYKDPSSPKAADLSINNLILRGSKLKETEWVVGIATYTGMQTKVWLNFKKTFKSSTHIEGRCNYISLLGAVAALAFSLVFSLLDYYGEFRELNFFSNFLEYLNSFSTLVPIPLFLVLEVVKVAQGLKANSQRTQFKNFNIIDQLGTVDYMLIEKSGTITEDRLEVRTCIIKDELYWNLWSNSPRESTQLLKNELLTFENLRQDFELGVPEVLHFIFAMTLCENVVPTKSDFSSLIHIDKKIVEHAQMLGATLTFKDSNYATISASGCNYNFEILGQSTVPNYHRIVVRNLDTDETYLYMKGNYENVIPFTNLTDSKIEELEDMLELHDIRGMRQLYLAYKELSYEEYKQFKYAYTHALLSPVNSRGRVEGVLEEYQQGSSLLGILGLQEVISQETKDSLSALKVAGINIWIVSGDSEENVMSAGLSSGIIDHFTEVAKINGIKSEEEMLIKLQDLVNFHLFALERLSGVSIKEEIFRGNRVSTLYESNDKSTQEYKRDRNFSKRRSLARLSRVDSKINLKKKTIFEPLVKNSQVNTLNRPFDPERVKYIVCLDSYPLEFAKHSSQIRKLLTILLFSAENVIFHSLLPSHKAMVAQLLRNNFSTSPVVLSVGKNRSDIGMISQSHISVCLRKNSTAEFSDVQLDEFSQLKDLCLNLGQKSNSSLTQMALIYISLACLITLLQVAGYFIEPRLLLLLVLSSALGITALFDEHIPFPKVARNPDVYRVTAFWFTWKNTLGFALQGVVLALLIITFGVFFQSQVVSRDGYTQNYYLIEDYLFISSYLAISLMSILYTRSFNIFTVGIHLISALIVVALVLVLGDSNTFPSVLVTQILASAGACLVVSYVWSRYKDLVSPGPLELLKHLSPQQRIEIKLAKPLSKFKNKLQQVYKKTKDFVAVKVYNLDINFKKLRFVSNKLESEYNTELSYQVSGYFKFIFTMIFLFIFSAFLFTLISQDRDIARLILQAILTIIVLMFAIVSFSSLFLKVFRYFIPAFYLFSILTLAGSIFFENESSVVRFGIFPLIYFIALSSQWMYMVFVNALCTVFSISNALIYFWNQESGFAFAFMSLYYIAYYLAITSTAGIIAYQLDKSKRDEFILLKKRRIEMEKSENVLKYILPAFVRKRVKNGVRYIAEEQGTVSIVFCNISHFDKIVTMYSPQELTAFLDKVFSEFDKICEAVGVTKIETVGYTYMACAGLKDSEAELDPAFTQVPHARRAVELGVSIINSLNHIYLIDGSYLQVKIGIHTGVVTAGVVGAHKPQFSLVGDTVNTASRMCSTNSVQNSIQISNECFELLGDRSGLSFEPNCVEAKGKGQLKTFKVSVKTGPEESSLRIRPSVNLGVPQNFNGAASTANAILQTMDVNNTRELLKRSETGLVDKIAILACCCNDSENERAFRASTLENRYNLILYGLKVTAVTKIFISVLALAYTIYRNQGDYYVFFGLTLLEAVTYTVFAKLQKKYYTKTWYSWMLQAVYLISFVWNLTLGSLHDEDTKELFYIKNLYHFILMTHCSQLFYSDILWTTILAFMMSTAELFIGSGVEERGEVVIFTMIFIGISLVTLYYRESKLRELSTIKSRSLKELKKTEELLTNMMPPHVYEQLKEESTMTDSVSEVTMIYADIVGFTSWSSDKRPLEVVEMLSELFTKFDHLCVKHNVYKVHTIGDCYVVMGNAGDTYRDPPAEAYNMIRFAVDLLQNIRDVNVEYGTQLNMRIGMHTGEVIGGIAGTSIVRYDIYGPDVLIANKIESNGVPGKIAVSEATKEILAGNFEFNWHKKIEVRSLSKEIDSYLLDLE